MEIIGTICGISICAVFVALIVWEWMLWRKRTLTETEKLEAEARFYDACTRITEVA